MVIESTNKTMNRTLEIWCLKMKVRKLKSYREELISTTRKHYPIAVQKVDDIESLNSKAFEEIDKEIEKYERLLEFKKLRKS